MRSPFDPTGKAAPLDIEAIRGAGSRPPVPPGLDPSPPLNSLQLYLPEFAPIPGATEFARDAFQASPAAGTIVPAGLIFDTPQSSLGIIRVFSVGLDDMTQATNVTFSLRINDRPVPGWGAFRMFPGLAARVTSSVGTWVPVPPSSRISVAIINTDGAAYLVGAAYSGWYWPESLDRAWRGLLYQQRGGAR